MSAQHKVCTRDESYKGYRWMRALLGAGRKQCCQTDKSVTNVKRKTAKERASLPKEKKNRSFPDGESNPARGCERAES
jgi:hypothetical protein